MRRLELKILDERIRSMLPHYATAGAAGLDLRACIAAPLTLHPGDSHLVRAGIAIHPGDPGYAAMLLPRSALASNHDIALGSLLASTTSANHVEGRLSACDWLK